MMPSLIVSIIAILVSVINLVFFIRLSSQNNRLIKTQTTTAQGALESQVRSAITDAGRDLAEAALMLEERPNSEIALNVFNAADERYRNAYEDACAKYIDGKIDKERFKKMYSMEIYKLIHNESEAKYYEGLQTEFQSTVAVYKEWFEHN